MASTSKIIQIDPAKIRTLASPSLQATIKKDEAHQVALAAKIGQATARIAELTIRVAGLQAQDEKLSAERNAANARADQAQAEMIDALSEGRDIDALRKTFSESRAQAVDAHEVLASVERVLLPMRKELDALKTGMFGLRSGVTYAENAIAVRDCRLLLAEAVRQILEHYPDRVLDQVQSQLATFGTPLKWLPKNDLSLPDDPRQALERDWAELEALDAAKIETAKAFITTAPTSSIDGAGATVDEANTGSELDQQDQLQVRAAKDGHQFVAPMQKRIETHTGSRKAHTREAKETQTALSGDEPVIGADFPDSDE